MEFDYGTGEATKDSIHNFNNDDDESATARQQIPSQQYIPRIFLFDHGPIEATGLAFNSLARGAVVMSTLFLGPALLKLAEAAAKSNCNEESEEYDDCIDGGGRIYGMRPTSLLTNIGVFSGLLSGICTPLFGSLVDHTPHRKAIGQGSAILLSIVKGVEILVNQSTWFMVSVLQVVNFVVWNAYLCATYAYTAELSTVPNKQTHYNTRFQTLYYISLLAFLILVMVISTVLGTGDIGTARISQTVAFLVCNTVFGVSWKWLFRPRPALREVPPGSTLLKSGFQKLSFTFSYIWSNDNWYVVRYFLLAVMLSESATAALSTISTTYMTHVLEMDANEIGKVFMACFVAGIPGAKLGGIVGVALNPLRSALLCLVVFIVNTTLAAITLTGPDSKNVMYFFSAIWGVCLSWLHPTHASLYCTIIPRGQESTLMGIYIFSGSVLAWLPPLLFSFLNEIGASMSIGLASLNLFFAGGFILLLMIGNYDEAIAVSQNGSMAWTSIDNGYATPDGERKPALT
ncbi:hypothetical protein ACHAXR_002468 [Thalassiosira sp. AJA248-18]